MQHLSNYTKDYIIQNHEKKIIFKKAKIQDFMYETSFLLMPYPATLEWFQPCGCTLKHGKRFKKNEFMTYFDKNSRGAHVNWNWASLML